MLRQLKQLVQPFSEHFKHLPTTKMLKQIEAIPFPTPFKSGSRKVNLSYEEGYLVGRDTANGYQLYSENAQECVFEILYSNYQKDEKGTIHPNILSERIGFALYNPLRLEKTPFIPVHSVDLDKCVNLLFQLQIPLCDFDSHTEKLSIHRRSSEILVMKIKQKVVGKDTGLFAKVFKNYVKGKQQADMLRKFQHKSIAKIEYLMYQDPYFCILQKNFPHQLIEFLPMVYFSIIQSQPKIRLSEQQLKKFMKNILSALNLMHCQNYGHFAIHPGHILLDEDLTPVLIGFRHPFNINTHPKGQEHDFPGKAGYTAPELYDRSLQKWSLSADIYSLGLIFYQLLSNTTAIPGSTIEEIAEVNKLGIVDLAAIKYLTPSVAFDLVNKMLKRSPQDRISAEAALEHDYFAERVAVGKENIFSFGGSQINQQIVSSRFEKHQKIFDNALQSPQLPSQQQSCADPHPLAINPENMIEMEEEMQPGNIFDIQKHNIMFEEQLQENTANSPKNGQPGNPSQSNYQKKNADQNLHGFLNLQFEEESSLQANGQRWRNLRTEQYESNLFVNSKNNTNNFLNRSKLQ